MCVSRDQEPDLVSALSFCHKGCVYPWQSLQFQDVFLFLLFQTCEALDQKQSSSFSTSAMSGIEEENTQKFAWASQHKANSNPVIHRLLGSFAAASFHDLKKSAGSPEKSSTNSDDLDGDKTSPLSLTTGIFTDSLQLLTSSTETCSNTLWWSDKRQISQLWNISFIADFWAKRYSLLLYSLIT